LSFTGKADVSLDFFGASSDIELDFSGDMN